MLTRKRQAALAPVLHDPVLFQDGLARLRLAPDLDIPLFNDGVPVRSFVEGWTPSLALTLFAPLLLLEFLHRSGRGGFWLIDRAGNFLGNDLRALPPHLLAIVRRRAAPALRWSAAMQWPGLPCVPPAAVAALSQTHADIRGEIARAVFEPGDPILAFPLSGGLPPAPAEPTTIAIDPARIRQQGVPIPLGPGWRIARVQTLFAPVIVLELLRDDGAEGVWYVDRDANYLGNDAAHLPGELHAHLKLWCAALFEEVWDRLLVGPALQPGPDLAIFLSFATGTRRDLFHFHAVDDAAIRHASLRWALTETLPPSMSYTVPTAAGRVILDPGHVAAACNQMLRTELFRQVHDGTMSWPSPVDGRRIEAAGRPLYLDDRVFAYKIHDERHDLTFYAIAQAEFFRTFGLYFPSADLVVAADPVALDATAGRFTRSREGLLRHAAEFGPDLLHALLHEPGEVVHAFRGYQAIHVGHFVWQDLSGVSYLVDAFEPERLPRFYVFDTPHHPELYGPVDEIFPELAGRVVRLPHGFNQHVGRFYRERQVVIKSTGISVPAQVGIRIVAALRRSARWSVPVAQALDAQAFGPVILVGLRIGNRTIEDMQGFAVRLVQMLAAALGRVTIVIDGHNSQADLPGTTYASFGDTLTGGSTFMQREGEIADEIARRFDGQTVRIVSLIGRPVPESVIWCSQASFFVAPWGAALAKYRWVCNRPGLTTIGRWNLEHRHDISIYHHPAAMEDPTPLLFNTLESVQDIDHPEALDRANYRLDEEMVFAQVRGLITDHVVLPKSIRASVLQAGS